MTLIGIVIVMLAVVGGYLLEGGNIHLLWQPIELLIIGGAALGAFLIANPMSLVKSTMAASRPSDAIPNTGQRRRVAIRATLIKSTGSSVDAL